MEYTTKSEIETKKIAQKIAKNLKPGNVLALSGDLGSGKTAFVKGLASAFKIDECITSPTFVFVKEYLVKKAQNPKLKVQISTLIHADCYRMKNELDAESVGLIDCLNDKNAIIAIEWPEKISSILPQKAIKIKFENLGGNVRKIIIN